MSNAPSATSTRTRSNTTIDTSRIVLIGPIENALLMVEALKKAGVDFKFHRHPTLGHMGIIDEVIEKSRAFLNEKSASP